MFVTVQQAAGAACWHWFSLPTLSCRSAPEGLEKYYTHHGFASQLRNSEPRESFPFIVSSKSKSLLLVTKGDSTSLLKVALLQMYLGEVAQGKSNGDLALLVFQDISECEREAQGGVSSNTPSLPHPIHFQVLEVFLFIWAPSPSFIHMRPASHGRFTSSSPFARCTTVLLPGFTAFLLTDPPSSLVPE